MVSRMRAALPFLAIGACALAVQSAWNVRRIRRPRPTGTQLAESVTVAIPARNEEATLRATLDSVRSQQGVPRLSIHVLDDGSADRTGEIADAAAREDPRVHVHHHPDTDPPPGWLGKNYACMNLARESDSDVLVFIDADVLLEPAAINALVAELRAGDFALVAPYPRQIAITWLERLMQPLLAWSWMTTVPLRVAESRQWASMSVANGQLMVFDAQAYRAIGGHEAVRGEVIEDVALMRLVREAGLRAATVDGATVASCRMYEDSSDLIEGYTKSAWNAFGGAIGSVAVNAAMLALYVAPPAAMLTRRGRTRLWGALGYAGAVVGRAVVARDRGERAWPDALAHPASIVAFVAINALSWSRHLRGTTSWKGRAIR